MKKPYALLAALIVASCGAFAQAYPSRPIRFVVGFPAGSSIDIVSRIVLDDIRERTGAAILVDNKAGALGSLGLADVVAAAPDGYTLMPSSSATTLFAWPATRPLSTWRSRVDRLSIRCATAARSAARAVESAFRKAVSASCDRTGHRAV